MSLPNGIWPTMVTPFTTSREVDYVALARQVEWYISKGVHGLFAVCQSSEMFYLTLDERVNIARTVKQVAGDRISVIASGHVSSSQEEQRIELEAMAQTGIDGLVLVTNRLVEANDSDAMWRENLQALLDRADIGIPLGLYECPYPYKRLLTPDVLRWCAEAENFVFLKDTSCSLRHMEDKLKAVRSTNLKLYNANSATLLDSLKLGVDGYSGVMANLHPELYVWLFENWRSHSTEAANVGDFLSMASLMETQLYPACAKHYLVLEGIFENIICRSQVDDQFAHIHRLQVEQLHRLSQAVAMSLGISSQV